MTKVLQTSLKTFGVKSIKDLSPKILSELFFEISERKYNGDIPLILLNSKNMILSQWGHLRKENLDPRMNCPECIGGIVHSKKMEVRFLKETCYFCNGSGIKTVPCALCRGKGVDEQGNNCSLCKGSKVYIFRANKKREEDIPCPRCKGRGHILKTIKKISHTVPKVCGNCDGRGFVEGEGRITEDDIKLIMTTVFGVAAV